MKAASVRVNKVAANIVGGVLTVVLCLAGLALAQLLPHRSPPALWNLPALVISLVLLPVVHEAVHAVGLRRFAGVEWSRIKFGFIWRALMPYCHCTVPISVRAYRKMALLPLQVTGAASLGPFLVFPSDWLALIAGVAVAACVGDVWIVVKLRRFREGWLVSDSPTEIGCDVFEPPESRRQ